MDNNFAEFLTTGGWNTPTHILERRLILSVVKVLCAGCTHSLHPHCTCKVENAKGKGCTCTRCTRGSGIPVSTHFLRYRFLSHTCCLTCRVSLALSCILLVRFYLNGSVLGTGHNLSGGWGGVIQNFKE